IIVIDLPDPGNLVSNQYYTTEFYQLCHASLTKEGVLVSQTGSPYFATRAFYTIKATMEHAGFQTIPYHNQILTLGEWSWIIGTKGYLTRDVLMNADFDTGPLRWLNREAMQMMMSFGKVTSDTSNIKINSLKDPSTFIYYVQGNWSLQ
ncbi:MAG: spermidine synthase, partial [Bacteroidota bacterium]